MERSHQTVQRHRLHSNAASEWQRWLSTQKSDKGNKFKLISGDWASGSCLSSNLAALLGVEPWKNAPLQVQKFDFCWLEDLDNAPQRTFKGPDLFPSQAAAQSSYRLVCNVRMEFFIDGTAEGSAELRGTGGHPWGPAGVVMAWRWKSAAKEGANVLGKCCSTAGDQLLSCQKSMQMQHALVFLA